MEFEKARPLSKTSTVDMRSREGTVKSHRAYNKNSRKLKIKLKGNKHAASKTKLSPFKFSKFDQSIYLLNVFY